MSEKEYYNPKLHSKKLSKNVVITLTLESYFLTTSHNQFGTFLDSKLSFDEHLNDIGSKVINEKTLTHFASLFIYKITSYYLQMLLQTLS